MPNWLCSECDGGFPKPIKTMDGYCCPHCGHRMIGTDYQFEKTYNR